MLTGVVEVGLFCHMARAAYFGNEVRISLLVYWLFSDSRAQQDESVTVRWNDGKVVTLKEKISFVTAVLNIFISGYLIGGFPEYFHYWYTAQLA